MPKNKHDETHFAEMLCTKFCHDMAGAVSAVNNGVEFLFDETDEATREQAMSLLKLSAKEGLSKLQIYRIAYGRAAASSDTEIGEVRDMMVDFFENSRIELDWLGKDGDKTGNEMRRIMVNMILRVAGHLAYGGKLSVIIENDGRKVTVTGKNDRIKAESEVKKAIDGDLKDELSPYNVAARFLKKIVDEAGIKLSISLTENEVDLIAVY